MKYNPEEGANALAAFLNDQRNFQIALEKAKREGRRYVEYETITGAIARRWFYGGRWWEKAPHEYLSKKDFQGLTAYGV